MCGIAGFVSTGSRRPGEAVLHAMGDAMAHRGPDASGAYLSPDGTVGLSHRRLSVIDPSPTGAQPMVSPDGLRVLSFNGEIYNFREIREDLVARGHTFRGGSDTEVVLTAFRQWGVEASVRRFNGMFALALWDSEAQRVYVVRDRLGIKPLYLAQLPGLFLFASELKALLAFPGFPRQLDRAALQYFLEFQYVPLPHSIYRNVQKVRPGHIVELGLDGTLAERPYWDLLGHWGAHAGARRSVDECEEELSHLLASSIRYRMISDVPLGAFLSGGVDSSLVVALMAATTSQRVKTFSIGFRESGYDESPHARAIAKHLGTDHHEKICTPQEAQTLVRKIPDAYDEPFGDSSAIPTMLVSEFTRQHVTVSLSGDGGDELFCGYPRYAWVRQGGRAQAIPGALRKPVCSLLSRIPVHKIQRGAESLIPNDAAEMYFHTVGVFERRRLAEILPNVVEDATLPFFRTFRDPRLTGVVERAMATDMGTYLVDDILTKIDRASMAHSLEARVPLLDHRIVELAAGLAMQHKVHRGQRKHLLRRVLYRHVPQSLLDRPKMGFGIPVNRWLRGELRPLLAEYLNGPRVRREGYLRAEGVERIVQEHLSKRRDHQYRLWSLLVFAMWCERYHPSS